VSTPSRVPAPQPSQVLMQLSIGFMMTAALHAAAELRIADLLKDGAKSTRELAAASGTHEDSLYRVMRALASAGVFNETSPRVFELTDAGELLRTDHEESCRDMVLWMGNKFHYDMYPEMQHAMKTGETVVEKVYSESCFGYLEKDKEVGEIFNRAMTMFSKMLGPAVLEAYDFSYLNGKTLVDIGGGHGVLLTSILKKYPDIRGLIFDLEHVHTGAQARINETGVAGRCETHGGDFFKSVPPGDAYIMKHIIHDWSDAKALTILKNCHAAGRGKSKVILVEAVLTPGNEPNFAKWLDLEMLLIPGGRERTEAEFARLFEQAGFNLMRVLPTKSPVCVLEAEKRS
jgi:hypothetical protein